MDLKFPALSPANATPFVTNFDPTVLRKWRKGLARQRLGVGNAVIACIGDSTTVGTGSVAGGLAAGVKANSYPSRLAALLTSAGVTAGSLNHFGDMGYGSSITTYVTELSLGSWTLGSPNNFAAQSFLASATTASPLSFTPAVNTDTCEVYFLTNVALGSFSWKVNSGSSTTQSSVASPGVGKLVISASLGANTYSFNWVSGSNFIIGFSAYNSAQKQVSVLNMGHGGGKAADLLNVFQTPAAHLTGIGADLAIIEIGINDWQQATSVSAFTTSLTTVVQGAQSVCDVILVSPFFSSTGTYSQAVQSAIASACAAVAASCGVPYFDMNGRWGGFTNANADGLMYTDGIHGTSYGYTDEAQFLAKMLLSV